MSGEKAKSPYCCSGESFRGLPQPRRGSNSSVVCRLTEMRKLLGKSEAGRSWFMKFEERSCLCNVKRKVKQQLLTWKLQRYPEDPAQIPGEGGCTEQQIFSVGESA